MNIDEHNKTVNALKKLIRKCMKIKVFNILTRAYDIDGYETGDFLQRKMEKRQKKKGRLYVRNCRHFKITNAFWLPNK